jgi:uncharacterized RDD family membrane protein YckC
VPPSIERPAATPRQALLFQEKASSKVIPFDGRATPASNPNSLAEPSPPKTRTRSPTRPPMRRPAATEVQPSLEFLEAAPPVPRRLSTTVEAVIYCDAPVALPIHRACATAIDASMILIGCGFFVTTFYLLGGVLPFSRLTAITMAASLLIISMFYGWIWVWSGRRTPGMRATRLTLINFDGYPPDRLARWLRFLGACIGFCAGGLGVLWALLDEESLSWHDHISKTFPTFQISETNFVRRR